jgi:hypothetical protein
VTREGTPAYALHPRLIEAETSGEDRLRKLMADLPVEFHEAGLLLIVRTLPDLRTRSPRPRPGALAGSCGIDRRRRHLFRRFSGSRLAPARQAPLIRLTEGNGGG